MRLVEDGAGENLHEIGIADEDGERGILDDVEILARQRRRDEAHRLRDDDEPHRQAAMQTQRARGLALAVRHRQHAGANDLGDERRR